MENSHINEAPPPPPLAAEQLFANVDGMDNNDNDLVAADDGILNGGNGMFDYHYDTFDSLLLYLINRLCIQYINLSRQPIQLVARCCLLSPALFSVTVSA